MTTSADDKDRSAGSSAGSSHRYHLREVIGRGGMATVYRAFDEVAEMDVAVKLLHEHLADDPAMVEVFQREAALMQRVDHPGVVELFATVEIDARPGIVMELCQGGDLSHRIARRGSFDEEDAVDIVVDVLDTLAACHEAGIVHRDIKPHNVVFDEEGKPKLIDFGIGQAEELMAADEAGQVGTVEYMAPERIDGLAIDGRSDIYSVGILLFELLCGHVPYRADSASEVLRMHREAEVADPRVFEPEVSAAVADAVMCAMAKQPEERFDHPAQMAAALRGDDAIRSEIPPHPSWRALREQFGDQFTLGASPELDTEEWVVYVPPHLVEEGARQGADYDAAIGELIDDYAPYFTIADDEVDHHPGIDGNSHFEKDEERRTVDFDGRGQEAVTRYGIARGLSRQGVDVVTKRLEEKSLIVRFNRRPRDRRHESPWKIWSTSMAALEAMTKFTAWGPTAIIAVLLIFQPGGEGFTFGSVVLASVLAGMAVGWIGISERFREWWLAHVSRSYLLDFCQNRIASKGGSLITKEHAELVDEIESPRVAASFERAVNAVLHLGDLCGGDGKDSIESLADKLRSLGARIVNTETKAVAVRPARTTNQIRRLDRQIVTSDDIHAVESWVEQKLELRHQLVQQDEIQRLLQIQTQRLHGLAAHLEELVCRHSQAVADNEEISIDDDDELRVVLEFEWTEVGQPQTADIES